MDSEFLYFGHFEAEKIEFEVGRSNLKNLEKNFQYWGAGYFNYETQFPIKIEYQVW